jgi:hypothetical protein
VSGYAGILRRRLRRRTVRTAGYPLRATPGGGWLTRFQTLHADTGARYKESAVSREHSIELYERLVAANPIVERKGDTMPYTSVNGHMFSVVTKDGHVALRLPPEQRDAFLKKYKTTLCTMYGMVMKEYVVVPETLLAKTKELKPYFDASYAFVGSLKPKATTRKKTGGASKKRVTVARPASRPPASRRARRP